MGGILKMRDPTNAVPTNKDAGAEQWQLNDEVIRLRRWAADENKLFPKETSDELVIGSGEASWLRLEDEQGRVSRRHATLSCKDGKWILRDAGSTNGMMADRVLCSEAKLEPGMEIWLGGVALVAESQRSIALRAFLARLLGWSNERMQEVDLALRSIRIATKRQAALVLCGADELALLARALHRRVLGAARPFVVCDPRRQRADENVRAAENHKSGMAALRAAKEGSLCIWSNKLPSDFAKMKSALDHPDTRVQLIVCGAKASDAEAFGAAPISVPALSSRNSDLPRIVEEYAHDITAELGLPRTKFSRSDQQWVVAHGSNSFPEIEKVILRILRIRETDGDLRPAAVHLGMDRWSLAKWVQRRNPPVPSKRDKQR